MAYIKLSPNFSMNDLYLLNDDNAQLIKRNESGFSFVNTNTGVTGEVTGVNMTYNEDGWSGGTATSVIFKLNGQTLISFTDTNISGNANYYDIGYGGEALGMTSEVAYWMRGNDTIEGSSGNEYLKGWGGNDTFIGSIGNDTIDGGTGTDTVLYNALSSEFTITKFSNGYSISSKSFGTDTLLNIENLQFSDAIFSISEAELKLGNKTAIFLQETYKLTIQEARNWVMSRIEKPQDIYDACTQYKITSEMLADIVQDSFPETQITGTIVNIWLIQNNMPTLP